MNFDITIIVAFLAINLLLGFFTGKGIKTLDHFSVGNRSFSTFVIFATLTASFVGGGYTIGNAGKVYHVGMIYSFALLGFSLKEILVALLIAPRMDKHRDCLSIGDMMAKKYGNTAKVITGIFSVLICAGILGAQVGGMGAVFHQFFAIKPAIGVFIGFSVIIIYSTLGGMRAVVYTDVLQFFILVIGIPLTFFIGLYKIGGWSELITKIPPEHISFIQSKSDFIKFLALFVTFIFGETLVPPYVQRLFMAKNSRITRNATLYSGIISIPIFIIVGAIGLLAQYFDSSLSANGALLYVVERVLPPIVRGFVIAAILAIIMSSAAGFLNAAAVSFVNDIVRPITQDKLSQRRLIQLAKISTAITGIISVVFALAINNVLDILLFAYNFWSPIIIIPLCAVIFDLKCNSRDFIAGSTSGIIATLVWKFALHDPWLLNSVLVGVMANAIGFSCSYLWQRTQSIKFAEEL